MKIYLDFKDTCISESGRKISTYRRLTKEIMSPLRGNPLYPYFQIYVKKNTARLLEDFQGPERACRVMALETLLDLE